MSRIEKLTPKQEALIPVYRKKWQKIALSTERIDRDKAEEVIKAVYALAEIKEPKIIFCDSPYQAGTAVISNLNNKQFKKIYFDLQDVIDRLFNKLGWQSDRATQEIVKYVVSEIYRDVYEQVGSFMLALKQEIKNLAEIAWIQPVLLTPVCSYFEFLTNVCGYPIEVTQWPILPLLAKNLSCFFLYEEVAVICDRPLHLRFDHQNRLHAEGEAAIEYADGFSLYSYHGVTLPEKYGKVHPRQWQAQWLLTEDNAELRRVLIQGIGYARICQELQVIELDTWAEYTLLKIDADVDEEPIYLLKMTCPTTGFIHALRVPPEMKSAHEAICWVNWGIAPEEFAIQT